VTPAGDPKPGATRAVVVAVLLLLTAAGLQAVRDGRRDPAEPPPSMLWVTSGPAMQRLSLGYAPLVADVYWMRAVVYYGGQRLSEAATRNFDLLFPMLDLVTTLDPRFRVAYRFGAIFLTEAYPNGPGRPDQAIALLERAIDRDGARWEYMHDIGFIHYWWYQDYPQAAQWFERASRQPGAAHWLAPLAATTLAVGGDRESSRLLWQQMRDTADSDWIRNSAERRLLQLEAMDLIDRLNAMSQQYAAREGRVPATWQALVRDGLRAIPLDPTGTPFILDPSTGRAGLSADSPLAPLPTEPPRPGAPKQP
jgi:tetratricopeptide (TPR) repeat protein